MESKLRLESLPLEHLTEHNQARNPRNIERNLNMFLSNYTHGNHALHRCTSKNHTAFQSLRRAGLSP
jgi:hypothetical protein